MSSKFALIIANTEYTDPGLAQLTAPGKDAKEFGRVLDSPEIGAFNDVTILFNENASKAKEMIDRFFSAKKPDDLLVLYFSGHGVRDEYGSLYLAVKNTSRDYLRSTAIESDFITKAMDQSRSKRQVLILDCCNSGAFAQGSKGATGVSIGTASAFEGTGYGRIVLTASDSTQFAWEGDQVMGETENSLFTHFLVKGLEGEADSDGDGRITIDELYDYAYEKIVNITPKQTPGKWSYKQQGEIFLRQNIRIEDTKPVPLPDDLVSAITSSLPYIREGAVSQLELLLKGKNLSLARSARFALQRIVAEDDSRRVAQAAAKALESVLQAGQKEAQKAELEERLKEEYIAHEKDNAQRKAQEEAQYLATQKAGEEHLALENARALPAPAKSRLIPIAIWGVVIILIAAGGYAAMIFLGLPLGSPLTATPLATRAPTEDVPAPTEALIIQAPTEAESTPTEEPSATPEPTENATLTPSGPLPEIDSKGAVMVLVPAGDFTMGSNTGDPDEKPSHTVSLDAYYIDKFEVTNALYKVCVDDGKCEAPKFDYFFSTSPNRKYFGNPDYDRYPVVYVDWNMAKAYCEWRGVRLPTEAEWEKAARGDTDTGIYPWGRTAPACQLANFQNCEGRTGPVGDYEDGKSQYGVYDMAGNVWEWVADWYAQDYYGKSPSANPPGNRLGQSRVLRGGSWTKYDIRISNRLPYDPNSTNFDIGFRCVSGISP